MVILTQLVVKGYQKQNRLTKASLKSVKFTVFLGQSSANLHGILISGFFGNHFQKKGNALFCGSFFNKSN